MNADVVVLEPDHVNLVFDDTLVLFRRLASEEDPELDIEPHEGLRSKLRGNATFEKVALVALSGGTPVGLARMWVIHIEGGTERAEVRIDVDPEHRRTGVGKALLRSVLDVCDDKGRTILTGMGPNTEANNGFWTSVGATLDLVECESRMWIAEADAELMNRWVEARLDRASNYKLVHWRGPTPRQWLATMATLLTAMNDAPTGDLDWADDLWTAEDVMDLDAYFGAAGVERHVSVVIGPEESPAGLTEMATSPHQPRFAGQGNTVVIDAHRNRGIGRWLKADMWLRLRSDAPQVEAIDTENASSNHAMLAINLAMGFAPRAEQGLWQAEVNTIREELELRRSLKK
jgi:mycothiol synthase